MVHIKYDESLIVDGECLFDLKEIRLKPSFKTKRKELICVLFHEFFHCLLHSLHMPEVSHVIFDYVDGAIGVCLYFRRVMRITPSDWKGYTEWILKKKRERRNKTTREKGLC